MDWLKALWSGATGWASTIAAACGLATKTEEMIERKGDRDAGANAQTVTDQAAENARLKHALDVATNPPSADDSLRRGDF